MRGPWDSPSCYVLAQEVGLRVPHAVLAQAAITFLAQRISSTNSISVLGEVMAANMEEAAHTIGMDEGQHGWVLHPLSPWVSPLGPAYCFRLSLLLCPGKHKEGPRVHTSIQAGTPSSLVGQINLATGLSLIILGVPWVCSSLSPASQCWG